MTETTIEYRGSTYAVSELREEARRELDHASNIEQHNADGARQARARASTGSTWCSSTSGSSPTTGPVRSATAAGRSPTPTHNGPTLHNVDYRTGRHGKMTETTREPRRATEREIELAKQWVRANNAVTSADWEPIDEPEYAHALEIIIFANGRTVLTPARRGQLELGQAEASDD